VTIYILIPFLVIPQIVLSGVIVKFDKLNPNISSPVSIPMYGEFITARWGYEALAVKQFKDNKYERQFYPLDKIKSNSQYKKVYWYTEIKKDLDIISNGLSTGTLDENSVKKLEVVYNEFKKEQILFPDYKFDQIEYLRPGKITPEVIVQAKAYVDLLKQVYIAIYNDADNKIQALLNKFQSENKDMFYKLRDDYTNSSLEEFVTNKNETKGMIEFNGELVSKKDPIYITPSHNFVKAQFYAPQKKVFGTPVDTFIINVIVLWVMTIALYFALYFRLLKKLLDSGEVIMGKKLKGSE
jgi:hypothetical protein